MTHPNRRQPTRRKRESRASIVKSARRADEFFYRFELPITYAERKYGETNISRWTHGTILLVMLMFAARRIKFI